MNDTALFLFALLFFDEGETRNRETLCNKYILPPPDSRTNRSVHCIEVFKYEVKHFSTYDVE